MRDAALRQITTEVASHLNISYVEERYEPSRKLTSRFVYADKQMEIGSAGVLLELGFRGHPEPSRSVVMNSYLAQYIETREDKHEIDYAELDPITLDILAPERTLLEKIFALHGAAVNFQNGEGEEPLRLMARYYYDIKMLLDSNDVCSDVIGLGDMQSYSANELLQAGIGQPFSGPARPKEGYAHSPAFQPTSAILDVLNPAYDAAMKFVFVGAEKPTLEDCLMTVQTKSDLL